MLHANITALCLIEQELLPMEVLHCEKRIFFYLFGSYDADLDSMTFTYKLDPYATYANMNFLHQGFRELSSDRHTYTAKIIHDAALRVVKNLENFSVYPLVHYHTTRRKCLLSCRTYCMEFTALGHSCCSQPCRCCCVQETT